MSDRLHVPIDGRTRAFRKFVALLRLGSDLREVKVWRAWEGVPTDDDQPSIGQLPWVRLTPRADRSGWHSTAIHEMPLLVTIETAVAGTDVGESFNLWGAFELALYPQDAVKRAAWREALAEAGIESIEVTRPACGIDDPKAVASGMIVATGEVRLMMHFRT